MNEKTTVYLRADGDRRIGLGHVHRLLAVSEMLQQNFDCRFIIRSPLPGIKDLILKHGATLLELENKIPAAEEPETLLKKFNGREIIVLDGYYFDTAYQQKIKEKGSGLVCIDDIHEYHFVGDLVINPSGGIDPAQYSLAPSTRLLYGPTYALLKKPFLEKKKTPRNPFDNRLLICMGGADPDNNTQAVLKQALDFPFDGFSVIVGEAYPHRDALKNLITLQDKKIELLVNLSPQELADVMKRCNVAITSASGIAYEYLSIGGELYLKQTAENQKLLFNYLIDSQIAFSLHDFPVDERRVQQAQKRQLDIFDGASGQRILKVFNRMDFRLNLNIRKVEAGDLQTLFKWANDPELRSQSYSSAPITLDDHTRWFTKKITDPNSLLYIFEFKNSPVAQVRFDLTKDVIISYSIDKEHRGKGFGEIVLEQAIVEFKHDHQLPAKIVGYVKHENKSSNVIFQKLGFIQKETTDYPNSYRFEYTI